MSLLVLDFQEPSHPDGEIKTENTGKNRLCTKGKIAKLSIIPSPISNTLRQFSCTKELPIHINWS